MRPEITVDIASQQLQLIAADGVHEYRISSARKGTGQRYGSEQTPTGRHIIRAKIGAGLPLNTIFIGRRPTGEIYSCELGQKYPQRDWILTRILWLSGQEVGHNRLGGVDTMRRYIYIHGAPDEHKMGIPGSRGCIRMANYDLIELFSAVEVGTPVMIKEHSQCR